MSSVNLTIATVPKAFEGDTDWRQRNAIESWKRSAGDAEILLIGDDPGTDEAAEELEVRHVSGVDVDGEGVPLVDSVFELAQERASGEILLYLNADILLRPEFKTTLERLRRAAGHRSFLGIGYRWEADVTGPIDFDGDWPTKLEEAVLEKCPHPTCAGIDYFLFPSGTFHDIPPMSIGRGYWDSWLVYRARYKGAAVIDLSPSLKVVHQSHDYGHLDGPSREYWVTPTGRKNYRLSGGRKHFFNMKDAGWRLTSEALERETRPSLLVRRLVTQSLIVIEKLPLLGDLLTDYVEGLLKVREKVRAWLHGDVSERPIRAIEKYHFVGD